MHGEVGSQEGVPFTVRYMVPRSGRRQIWRCPPRKAHLPCLLPPPETWLQSRLGGALWERGRGQMEGEGGCPNTHR